MSEFESLRSLHGFLDEFRVNALENQKRAKKRKWTKSERYYAGMAQAYANARAMVYGHIKGIDAKGMK